MKKRSSHKLGKVQLDIMNVLWDRGEATAKDLTDALSETQQIAHSTVQTLLRTLEAKGAVTHEQRERTFIFKPLFERSDVEASSTHDLLTRVFQGSAYGLVAHLLKNETVSSEEIQRLRQLIDQHTTDTQ